MEIPRRKLTSATALSSALVLIVALAVLGADLMKVGDEREPRIMQTSRYLSQQRAIFQSGERQTDCSRARGDGNTPGASKELSAERNVMSAKGGGESSSAPLARCSSGTLLGGWDNETFVPLPYDSLAPFLAEARGGLSRAERSFFVEQRDGVDVPPRYLPVNYPVGASAKTPEEEPFAFSPPCYYHFYSKDEILRLFAGKWVYLFGDSNTRGMILGLLAILDPDHRSPYSAAKWFNGTTEDVEWPHVYRAHYFFREDGSILFKTGARHHPPPLPESGYSFRLSFRMTFDVEEMYETAQEMLGGGDWAPDLLYFSSGAWDSGKLGGDPGNWTFARFDQGYGRMFDLIAQKCDPKRQVCFWGTIGQLADYPLWWDALAMLQWRNMARVAARQMDAGNATTLHLLDRYWSSLGRPDQNFGGHMTKAFNVWLTQLLMNAYHTIAEERGLLANPVLLAQPSRSYRRDEVQCVLLPGRPGAQGRKVRCAKYPLRVDFEKGCAIERETDDPLVGHAEIMWARNCTPEVFL